MKFQPPLERATLIRRYKRFLADIDSPRGELTIHCANTGAMTGCGDSGDSIWYRYDPSPKKKLVGSWELTEKDGHLICINTARANSLVKEALAEGSIEELAWADKVLPEQADGHGSRVDFVLEGQGRRLWLEVKSVTLHLGDGLGAFPDAKSQRALKHLDALVAKVQAGEEAALLFTVLHTGIDKVQAASHIDPAYAQRLTEVVQAGVKVLARKARIDKDTMVLDRPVKVVI
ncbi:DNA/RNA nuclease SfsA [Gallaecimonas xiamenensis]|uniref:Sugar fermentation stimulation protein homolog n=1 Tax=Gallaecimonas xiamenensis 3-C-1 TaxID=745411 RepID=K2JF35_9GAMM|nr:DNA/RNA nuclease SfsA [Gallaecimonas xiamenensis]EKE73683.1 DNA-binding transcriptional regulator [Gallaecimonas xiamenensis 3-C-1]